MIVFCPKCGTGHHIPESDNVLVKECVLRCVNFVCDVHITFAQTKSFLGKAMGVSVGASWVKEEGQSGKR